MLEVKKTLLDVEQETICSDGGKCLEALITLLIIILVSIIINKVATAALRRTGLPKDVASF